MIVYDRFFYYLTFSMRVLPLNVKLFLQFWFPKFHDSSLWLCRWEALAQLTTAFGILGLLIYLSYLYDAPSRNPAVSIYQKFPIQNFFDLFDRFFRFRGSSPTTICTWREGVTLPDHPLMRRGGRKSRQPTELSIALRFRVSQQFIRNNLVITRNGE